MSMIIFQSKIQCSFHCKQIYCKCQTSALPGDLVNFIHRQILHRFESSDRTDEIPMCHLRLILTRFMKGRLFFWADFMNKNDKNIPVNIEMENEESFASKSTRSTVIPQLK